MKLEPPAQVSPLDTCAGSPVYWRLLYESEQHMTTAQLLWFLVANAGILAANGFLARESFRAMRHAQYASIVAACHADQEREGDEV